MTDRAHLTIDPVDITCVAARHLALIYHQTHGAVRLPLTRIQGSHAPAAKS